MSAEAERRYAAIRASAEREGIDAVLVCGSEYTGFEGAIRYVSGFRIVHRYAYVLLPVGEEPTIVFPREARWVGFHPESWIEDRVFPDQPGQWLRERCEGRRWRRLGVYGLDYVLTVRDYRAVAAGTLELVPFDAQLDLARAVKSEEELASVRESMAINEEGFWAVLEAYEPGKTEAELMAPAEELFTRRGCARLTMDMVLWGPDGSSRPEFRHPDPKRRIGPDDLLLYSLELAGPGGHWVEFSRPIIAGAPSAMTLELLEAYQEYFEAVKETMHEGATAHDVHRAAAEPFERRGFALGHVTGHSIGMTMIELPRIGEGAETVLRENMVFSMHPHAISPDETACLYMQDTFRVGKTEGEPLSQIPLRIFNGSESR